MTPRFHTDERLSQCKCGKSHWEFPNSGESTVPEMAGWNCEDFHFSFFRDSDSAVLHKTLVSFEFSFQLTVVSTVGLCLLRYQSPKLKTTELQNERSTQYRVNINGKHSDTDDLVGGHCWLTFSMADNIG